MFFKNEKEKCFAYLAHTACDNNNFILDFHITSGNIHDSVAFSDLYQKIKNNSKQHTTAIAIDAGYITPYICKTILEKDNLGTIKVENINFNVSFPHKVGLHNSCHGHRVLKLATASELNIPYDSKLKNLLNTISDIELVTLKREDECCGFGGTFSVQEEAISVAMGKDRIKDHIDSKAEIMTGADMSCLMHMDGIINRDKNPIKVMHIVEILAGVKP